MLSMDLYTYLVIAVLVLAFHGFLRFRNRQSLIFSAGHVGVYRRNLSRPVHLAGLQILKKQSNRFVDFVNNRSKFKMKATTQDLVSCQGTITEILDMPSEHIVRFTFRQADGLQMNMIHDRDEYLDMVGDAFFKYQDQQVRRLWITINTNRSLLAAKPSSILIFNQSIPTWLRTDIIPI